MQGETSPSHLEQLQRQVKVLNRLAEISLVLNSTLDLETLLGYLMDAAAEITASEAASVLLWEPQTRELRFAATTTDRTQTALIGLSVPLEGSIAGTVLQKNQIMVVENVASDPRHYDRLDQEHRFETRSLLAVPLTSKDRVIGVLEVINKRRLPWTDEDRDYVSVLAAQAAVAIEDAQLVAALKRANHELNELDKLKNDFIAIASHELRTPLSVILGYASFLQDEAKGQFGELVNKVIASALQLRGIIEDLTNLRYLQQSAAELQRESVPLAVLIEEAVHDMFSTAEAKGQKVRLELPPESVIVQADRIRAGMALTNLLNNAVRFTPEGGQISVRGELHPGEARIIVSDNGIGLTEEQLGRVFDKFYQAEDHMTRKHGGLGIGLSIARALVEAHGGRIWASSAGLGQGAVFTFTLPVETAG